MQNTCLVFWRDVPKIQKNLLIFLHALIDSEKISIVFQNDAKFNKNDIKLFDSIREYELNYFEPFRKQNNVSTFKSIYLSLKAIFLYIKFILFFISNKPVSDLKIFMHGIDLGDLIYDSYIRYNNNYSKLFLKSFNLYKIILVALFKCEFVFRSIILHKPKYIIYTTQAYISLSGMAFRFAEVLEIKAFEISSYPRKYFESHHFSYNRFIDDQILNYTNSLSNWSFELDQYFNNLFKKEETSYLPKHVDLDNYDLNNAYLSKQVINVSDLEKLVFGDSKKSNFNVVVAAHVFSDAPNLNYRQIYRDYFSWFVETLKITSEIKSVNWIFKPHPSRGFYNEGDTFHKYFYKYKKDHMFLFPDSVSTKGVFDIAHTIITVRGTIGLEAACLGIPTILCGESPWSELGFSSLATNPKGYVDLLSNVKDSPKLSSHQILLARQAAHWYFLRSRVPAKFEMDDFDQKIEIKNTQSYLEFKEFIQGERLYFYQ